MALFKKDHADGYDFDVIIVGSGVAGAIAAWKLATYDDYRILILEAGDNGINEGQRVEFHHAAMAGVHAVVGGPFLAYLLARVPACSRPLRGPPALIELRFPGALLAYLRRVVQNRLVDERRRASRTVIPSPLLDEHATPGASPLDHTIDRDRRRRFRAGLSTLSPRDRRALVMRLEAGASYETIAAALGCPTPNAARVTVGRALHRLAEHMAAPARPAAAPPRRP